ncbi:IS256 family transposase [Nonomuraea sp. 10N515B]|uniref:IS256 family transposase n=1 Tax=Nonomuraea sp. 10N515B TaxID=3457422 RepID=UPI003FCDC94C
MPLTVVPELPADDRSPAGSSLIDQIVREGARKMLAAALQAEVDAYIAAFADERDEAGRRLVVRNGSHTPREILTAAGAIEVKAPRVNDKRIDEETGERRRFTSAILPAWCRKTPQISEVLPLLYLHGLSSGDFVPALGQFLGSSAGLSASVITKLTETWKGEQRVFAERDLCEVDYVYLWVDGIHVNIRLEEHKLCLLVMIGVRADGHKELVALSDGYRESAESWADLLRDAKRRGMRAPVLAIGDGALGFWSALGEVFPQARPQRCWFHKIANVLGAMPKSAHPAAKKHLAEIWNAEDKEHAERAVKEFQAAYAAKYPKAVAKVVDDLDELLAFYDYPAEHWVHLRTTNPIESTFATVRHRTKVTKGPGSRAAGLAMAFKLIESAQKRWRAVNAPHLVALVRAGATFVKGKLVERPEESPTIGGKSKAA